jgi:hypothetical protein
MWRTSDLAATILVLGGKLELEFALQVFERLRAVIMELAPMEMCPLTSAAHVERSQILASGASNDNCPLPRASLTGMHLPPPQSLYPLPPSQSLCPLPPPKSPCPLPPPQSLRLLSLPQSLGALGDEKF